MKKIIFLLAMTTFLFSDFAMQAQTKKELRAKRKAHREYMRMHNRMVREPTKYDRLPRRSKST